jgi:hypothetical protein
MDTFHRTLDEIEFPHGYIGSQVGLQENLRLRLKNVLVDVLMFMNRKQSQNHGVALPFQFSVISTERT